jgi:hypothetical protein
MGEKQANWATSLQEYDLKITLAQIVRGQGLCKLVVDSVQEQQSQTDMLIEDQSPIYCVQNPTNYWYDNIKFYLIHGSTPHHLDPKKMRALRLNSAPFHLVNGMLFRKKIDEILMHYLARDEAYKVLSELHAGESGGNFGGDTTTHKVLRAGYYCPTLFKDAHTLCRKCVICQKASGRVHKAAFSLQPVSVDFPFHNGVLTSLAQLNPPPHSSIN